MAQQDKAGGRSTVPQPIGGVRRGGVLLPGRCWLGVFLAGNDAFRVPGGRGIHGVIGQGVCHLVLGARHPVQAERRKAVDVFAGAQGQLLHIGVLDLPAAVDLFHYQLGIHVEFHLGSAHLGGGFKAAQQAVVLCDVIGGLGAYHVDNFAQDALPAAVIDNGAGTGYSGVAAGAAIGVDDDLH